MGVSRPAAPPRQDSHVQQPEGDDDVASIMSWGSEEEGFSVEQVEEEIQSLNTTIATLGGDRYKAISAFENIQLANVVAGLRKVVSCLQEELDSGFEADWRKLRDHPLKVTLERVSDLLECQFNVEFEEQLGGVTRAVQWLLEDRLWVEDIPLTATQMRALEFRKKH